MRTGVVVYNLVDTKDIDNCQATTEEAPAGMQFWAGEGSLIEQ